MYAGDGGAGRAETVVAALLPARRIRIVFAVLAILGIAGSTLGVGGIPLYLAGIPLYLACWLLIPEDGHEHSIAAHLLSSVQSRSR